MSALLGFRTINKCFMVRYEYIGTPPVLTPRPISILVPPSEAEIDPGVSLGEIKSRNCKGQLQTEFTYKEEVQPTLRLSFDLGGPEIEQMIHGKVVKTATNVATRVLFEAQATDTTIPGRAVGEHGYQVGPTVDADTAQAYYTDPLTKLSKPLAIVASGPTGDQIAIGENLAITLSTALAGTGAKIYGYVDVVQASATVMSATDMGLVGVYLSGIYHDGTVRELSARYCSLQYGSSLSADGKRQVDLRVLPDANSTSGLGWDVTEIPLQMAC